VQNLQLIKAKQSLMNLKIPNFLHLLLFILPIKLCASEIIPADSTRKIYHISGAVAVTQNGFSVIPMFTLGKPAAFFDLSVGNVRLAFEPQLRFSLEGRP